MVRLAGDCKTGGRAQQGVNSPATTRRHAEGENAEGEDATVIDMLKQGEEGFHYGYGEAAQQEPRELRIPVGVARRSYLGEERATDSPRSAAATRRRAEDAEDAMCPGRGPLETRRRLTAGDGATRR